MSPENLVRTSNHVLPEDQLTDLLRPGKEFESKLSGSVSNLSMGTANLLLIHVKDYSQAPAALLTSFQKQKMPGVYVTINKPYSDLIGHIRSPPENVRFVDVITALTGRATTDTASVMYLDSPLALVELNLAIADQLKALVSNQKFLILDSVSTLLVYNSPQSVEKFCHTVIAKNRQENVISFFLMIESEEHRSVVETLAQFVDNVIPLN